MSNLHLTCYLNQNRPQLNHSTVTDLPIDCLGSQLCSQLEASLMVDPFNLPACARSGRLWEQLLEDHRIPYLLLRVADMRLTLDSKITALALYEELQRILQDPEFEIWVIQSKSSILDDAQKQLHAYKTSVVFTPSQRWRSTAQMDGPFPYCRLQLDEIDALYSIWTSMDPPDVIMPKYMNLHSLETNVLEGTMEFSPNATAELIQFGFYNPSKFISDASIIGGTTRNCVDALSILRDTHRALNEVFSLLNSDPLVLTVETICRLHKVLMQTSRVLSNATAYGPRLYYLNIGVTRQVSQVNVTAISPEQGLKIQFCPYVEVEAELDTFCERFNELVKRPDIDPFAAAAWISHVFNIYYYPSL